MEIYETFNVFPYMPLSEQKPWILKKTHDVEILGTTAWEHNN